MSLTSDVVGRAEIGATASYDPQLSAVVRFGGVSSIEENGVSSRATWEFANGTWTQLSTVSDPTARAIEGLAFDPATKQLVLFGGTPNANATRAFRDTWVLKAS